MNKYTKAIMFATQKHQGQKRLNGDNYIIHPIRVSQEVHTELQKVAAVLHDTIEDTETTYEEIVQEFGPEVAVVVECLTHRKGESYAEYIQRVKANPDAVSIKLADIADNLGDYPSQNAIKKSAMALGELLTPKQ